MSEFDLEHLINNKLAPIAAKRFLPAADDLKHFINILNPFSEQIHHFYPHLYLGQIIDQRQLAAEKLWIVRDGLVPLVWFFLNNPSPKYTDFQLAVPTHLSPWVPTAWAEQVQTYQLSIQTKISPQNNKMLMAGLNSRCFFSEKSWEGHIIKIKQHILVNSIESLDIYFPMRWFPSESEDTFHNQALEKLLQTLSIPYRFINLKQLLRQTDPASFLTYKVCYIPNDGHFLWLDSMTNYLIRNRQVVPDLQTETLDKMRDVDPCFIDYKFQNCTKSGNEYEKIQKLNLVRVAESLQKASRWEAKLYLPWPNWFGLWLLKYIDNNLDNSVQGND